MTAFVPCPACGGPVHPIAGRCKHCKTDLNRVREQQAQAMRAAGMGAPPPATMGYAPAAPVHPATAGSGPVAAPPAERAPTAPPAQSPYAQGYGTAMPTSWSRRWPLLVGGIAVVVIAVSLIILFRGKSDASPSAAPGTSRTPRPVPDEMNQQGPLGQNLPLPPKIDPDDPTTRIDPSFPQPPSHGQRTAPTDEASFMVAVMETVCHKVDSCGMKDPMFQTVCTQIGSMARRLPRSTGKCTVNQVAVDACFAALDRMPCDTLSAGGDLTALLSMTNGIGECTAAVSCI